MALHCKALVLRPLVLRVDGTSVSPDIDDAIRRAVKDGLA